MLRPHICFCAAVLCLIESGSLLAVPTLRIADGINPSILVQDESLLDQWKGLGKEGDVVWSGKIGLWKITALGGLTSNGNATLPAMNLNFQAFSSGAGTLFLSFSNDFLGPTSADVLGEYSATVGSSSSVAFGSQFSASNVLFVGTPLMTSQAFGTGASAAESFGSIDLPESYSLTQAVTIVHGGKRTSSGSFHLSTTAVPDPSGTLELLMFSLTAVGIAANRFRAKPRAAH